MGIGRIGDWRGTPLLILALTDRDTTVQTTVMFALGRLPGWIAHWKEMRDDPAMRINRPRQIYVGETEREFVPLERR